MENGDGEMKMMRSLMGGELEDIEPEAEKDGWKKVKVKVLSPRRPCKPDYWGSKYDIVIFCQSSFNVLWHSLLPLLKPAIDDQAKHRVQF